MRGEATMGEASEVSAAPSTESSMATGGNVSNEDSTGDGSGENKKDSMSSGTAGSGTGTGASTTATTGKVEDTQPATKMTKSTTEISTSTKKPETLVCLLSRTNGFKLEILKACSSIVVILEKELADKDVEKCSELEDVSSMAPTTLAFSTNTQYSNGLEAAFSKVEELCENSQPRGLADVNATKSPNVGFTEAENISVVHIVGPVTPREDFLNSLRDMPRLSACQEGPPSANKEVMATATYIKAKLKVSVAIASTAALVFFDEYKGQAFCEIVNDVEVIEICPGVADIPDGWQETCGESVIIFETWKSLLQKREEAKKNDLICAVTDTESTEIMQKEAHIALQNFSCE